MGNLISCGLVGHGSSNQVVKVVHSNGLVDEFFRPVLVKELTVDYPNHFICHSNDLNIARTVPPLPDDEEMELGQVYFLLPQKIFESLLTEADVAALISKAAVSRKASQKSINLKHMPPLPPKPAFEMKLNGATTQVTVSREFLERLLAETRLQFETRSINLDVAESPLQSNPAKQQQQNCRSWRPRLETIEEGNFAL